MDGPYDPPSPPDLRPPTLDEAFGFKQDAEVPATVRLGMQQAADTLSSLRSTLNQHVTNQWANAAVATDMLQGKVAYGVNQTLQAAGAIAGQLQQPVAMTVLSPLSQAVERGASVGAVPPMEATFGTMPPCVMIRQAGLQGDLTAAIEAYRAMAFDQRFTRGKPYNDALQFITACLPDVPALKEQFAATVLQLQSLPPGVPIEPAPSPVKSPVVAQATAGQWIIATQDSAGTMSLYSVTPPPGIDPAGLGALGLLGLEQAGAQPVYLGVAPAGTGQGWVTTPLGFTKPVNAPVPSAAVISTAGTSSISSRPAPSFPGLGPPPCTDLQGMTVEQLISVLGVPGTVHPVNTQPGQQWGWTWAYAIGGQTGSPVITFSVVGDPGFGFPPYTCDTSVVGAAPGPLPALGGGPMTQGPAPVTTPPVVPTTTPKPTFRPEQPCIPICQPEKPPPVPCRYDVYCAYGSNVLYVVRTGLDPRNPNDVKLASGDCAELNWNQLLQQCSGSQQPQPSVPGVIQLQGGQIQGGCPDFPPAPVGAAPNGLLSFLQWVGVLNANGQANVPFPNAGITDVGKNLANSIVQLIVGLAGPLANAVDQALAGSGCADGTQVNLIATSALLGFAERYLGADLTQMSLPLRYQRQYRCPTMLPTIQEAANAWLANEIDEGTLRCWVNANNGRYPELATTIRAQRQKLSPLQYAALYMRDFLTRQDFELRVRSTGMIEATDPDDLLRLLQQIPPPGDIIRMMVRDSADDVLAAKFQLDLEFDQKFRGKLEDWARQQGMPTQYMQYLWRAHWAIPSPQQLLEMLHRLSRLPPHDPAYVDVDIVKRALAQQDIAPYWRDKFIAISYRPLTRIDAARAYKIGTLSFDELVNAYLDLGYNQDNANRLAKFQSRAADLTWARHWSVKASAQGELSDDEFIQALTNDGATQGGIAVAEDRRDLFAKAIQRKACLGSFRERFLRGDLDLQELQQALLSVGISAQQAEILQDAWNCQKAARGKSIPAGELCGLYEQGAINAADLVMRLTKVGYAYDDAVLLARRCAQRIQAKIDKQEEAALKEQERIANQIARNTLRSAAAQARQTRAQQQAAAKMQATKVAREKRLIEAGEKFSKHYSGSLADSILLIKSVYNQWLGRSLYTQDEIINALLVVTSSKEVFDLPSLAAALAAALVGVSVSANGQAAQATR